VVDMVKTFLISDTHFSHANILNFTRPDGERLRPFASVEEMDEVMVERWNSVVSAGDKVYHLGDFCINRRALPIARRLNGRKILIKGNHDIFKLHEYAALFDDVRAYWPLDGMLLSHIPVHHGQLEHRWSHNIHGHLHNHRLGDSRYECVCVEQINYTPVEWNYLREKLHERLNA
jgi:Predicted phosphoesterase or phosphohydrolase